MHPLLAYTNLRPSAALDQFRAILLRGAKPSNPAYLPVETLLVLASMRVIARNKFGGRNRHLMPAPAPQLAALTHRSLGSIHAKMANLDGSLQNAAGHETEVYDYFAAAPQELEETYLLMLAAARLVGISAVQLPDFLGLAGHSL